ncbi:molybdenum cofactor guanylyltransferase MobA [Roseibium sediminicola]|uniref:Molybdenum cofactor guanylyltransferase n=1 Tax=Roseibium sediminicola TaxID=2933272 RepID=A0ABT0GRS6_9HYPH|nr:molybdenum cofactor guanylyltransferase MobA [Roseibium sp. CAU 1639]MCK7612137.1 molybdenum cofactor guanylyltransferase MobA [Roseibium sp. CAU 1639]
MMASRQNLTKDKLLGCVLAGGQSRRMGGGDKSLMDLGGKSMLDLILARLRPQITDIVLNANGDPSRFKRFALPVVADPVGDYAGPLAGVLAGLSYAEQHKPEISHVVSVAGDTPFFPTDLVRRLSAAVPTDKPVIALASSSEKLHPVFGLWPVALRADLHDWLASGKSGKVLAFVDRHNSVEVAFSLDPATGLDPFFNANRPDDLTTVRDTLSQHIQ